MPFEDRTREIIYKKNFHPGPTLKLEENSRQYLKDFREEHKQFDEFLIGLGELLKAENNDEYSNLIKFIDGEPKANWIVPRDTMMDALIKLYNLCLSPKQAFEYIKECNDLYIGLEASDYELCGSAELSVRKERGEEKESKYLNFSVIEARPRWLIYTYLPVSMTMTIRLRDFEIETCTNETFPSTGIVFRDIQSDSEKAMDGLMLFDKYQNNKGLLKYIGIFGVVQFEKRGIIREVSHKLRNQKSLVCNYETNHEIGAIQIDKLSTENFE